MRIRLQPGKGHRSTRPETAFFLFSISYVFELLGKSPTAIIPLTVAQIPGFNTSFVNYLRAEGFVQWQLQLYSRRKWSVSPDVQKRLVFMQFHQPIRSGVTLSSSRDVDSIGGVDSRYGWAQEG